MTLVSTLELLSPAERRILEQTLTGEDAERYEAPERLRAAYTTLRAWSDDAGTIVEGWEGLTQAQKDAVVRETVRRLGIFFDRFADLLLTGG